MSAWFIDVDEDLRDAEFLDLPNEIYYREIDLPMRRIDAHTPFSSKA